MYAKVWPGRLGALSVLFCVALFAQGSLSLGESGSGEETVIAVSAATPAPLPDATATTQEMTAITAGDIPIAAETDAIPEEPVIPDISALPNVPDATETPAAHIAEETVPSCAIPDCPHVTTDEFGQTVAVCPLGEWLLTHPETNAEPLPDKAGLSLLSAADPQAALAGDFLSGGDIAFSDFTAITLDGTLQTATATWAVGNISDQRGTGDGWNLSLTLTQFKEWSGDSYDTYGDRLKETSVTVAIIPTVKLMDELSTPADQVTVIGSATALDTGTPVKLLSSAPGEGMGTYEVSTMTVALDVPANAYAHTYKTDATIALSTGP